METSASFEARYAPSPYPTGATVIYWTYDPLVARNAHLNFNRLGVRLAEYVEDMYGITDSTLHGGVPTDRLIVAWPTHDAAIEERLGEAQRALASVDCRMAPVATKAWIKGAAGASILPHCIRVAIPTNAESLLLDRSPDAAAWRLEVRRGIQGHSSDKGPIRRYPTLTLLTPRPYLKTPDPLRSSQPACNGTHAGGEDGSGADRIVREQRPHDRRADRVTDLLVEEVLERERPAACRLVARVEGRLGLEALERLDDARRVGDRLPVEEQDGQLRLPGRPQRRGM